jgi:hypothetical protein
MAGLIKRYIWLVAAFLVVLGIWQESILPRIQQTRELERECDQIEASLDTWNYAGQPAKQIVLDQKAHLNSLLNGPLKGRIVDRESLDVDFYAIQELAAQSRLAFQIDTLGINAVNKPDPFAIATTPTGPQVGYRELSVKVEGPFSGVYSFLQELERNKSLLRIERLTVTKQDLAPYDNTVSCKILVRQYFWMTKDGTKKGGL